LLIRFCHVPGGGCGRESCSINKDMVSRVATVSIPRNMVVNVSVQGDQIKKEDLEKIKSQFNRWIEGLEQAFEE
jgi:hypothetical protein